MRPKHTPAEAPAGLERDFIVADADYYRTRARQCLRQARATGDDPESVALASLALAFEDKARSLEE